MFHMLMFTFHKKKVLRWKKSKKLRTQIVNDGVKSLEEEDESLQTAWYSSTTALTMDYVQKHFRRV